jgi:GT2 family glycosyltransferase
MTRKSDLTVSIVLFKSNPLLVTKVIDSVYGSSLDFKLYLVDNSPTDSLKTLVRDKRTEYIFNNANLGFGKAHNIAIKKALDESKYHLVLNPDVYFDGIVLDQLFRYMEAHPEAGQITPKILYPDGNVQHLCKLLPAPIDLIFRRFFPWAPGAGQRNRKYELLDTGYNKTMNIPYLSGCFMFLRTSTLKQVGLFDERIFMYIEDADLTRRMHEKSETLFYPALTIFHHYAKGSYKNLKLMLYNMHGAWVYFNKWGWFVDRSRKRINQAVIDKYVRSN